MIVKEITIPYYGNSLSARIFLPENNLVRHPVVCKVHGLISNDFTKEEDLAELLTAEGIAYFVFHFTGFSTSSGETSIQTSLANLDYIISWLARQPMINPLQIALYGVSLGGAIATCHSSRDPRIAAIALQAPLYDFSFMVNYPEFDAMWEGLAMTGMIRLPKGGIKKQLMDDIIGNNPLECITKIAPRPVLIIAGGKDSFIPFEGIQELYQQASFPKKLEIVKEADHNLTSHVARLETFIHLRNFFVECLLQREMKYQTITNEISVM